MVASRLLSVLSLFCSAALSLPNHNRPGVLAPYRPGAFDGGLLNKRAACSCCLPASVTQIKTSTKTTYVNLMTSYTQWAATVTNTITPLGTITITKDDYVVISTKVITSTIATVPGTTVVQISLITPTVTAAGSTATTTAPTTSTLPGLAVTGITLPVKRALTTKSDCACLNSVCAQTATASTTITVTVTLTTLLSKQVSAQTSTTITGSTSYQTSTVSTSSSITEYDELDQTATSSPVTSTETSTGPVSTVYTTPPPITVFSTTKVTATPSATSYYSLITSYGPNMSPNHYWSVEGLGNKPYETEDMARAQCAQICALRGDSCQHFYIFYISSSTVWYNNYWDCGFWGINVVNGNTYTNTWNTAATYYVSPTPSYTYTQFQVFAHVPAPTAA